MAQNHSTIISQSIGETNKSLNHIEVAIRAYDPCLSCATHALGQMPLEIKLMAWDGSLLDRKVRGMD